MRVVYHPEFPKDIRRFERDYGKISDGLAKRFRNEVLAAVDKIKGSPESAGHFVKASSATPIQFRRCNLQSFPFLVLYAVTNELVVFGSVIPSRSDPLTWLTRFS